MTAPDYSLVRRFAAIRSAVDLDFGTIDPDAPDQARSFQIDSVLDVPGQITYAAPWLTCQPDTFRPGLTVCTVSLNMHALQRGATYTSEVRLTLRDEQLVIPVRVKVRRFSDTEVEQHLTQAASHLDLQHLLALLEVTTMPGHTLTAPLPQGLLRMVYRRAQAALVTQRWEQAVALYRLIKAHDPDFAADEQLAMAEQRQTQAAEAAALRRKEHNQNIKMWQDLEKLLCHHQHNALYQSYLNYVQREYQAAAFIQQLYQLLEQHAWEQVATVLTNIDKSATSFYQVFSELARVHARAAIETGLEQAIAQVYQQQWAEVQKLLERVDPADMAVSWLQHYARQQQRTEQSATDPIMVASDGTGHYTNLHEAIRHAARGASIVVFPGVYEDEENRRLSIHKPVSIVGKGACTDIIVQTTLPACITIASDDVFIQGLTLRSSARASSNDAATITLKQGRAIVDNCIITSTSGNGVFIGASNAQLALHASRISGKQCGLIVSKGGMVIADHCEIMNSDKGVMHRGYVHMYSCLIQNNREGINGHTDAHGFIEQCEFRDNVRYSHSYTGAGSTPHVVLKNNRDDKP